MWCQQFSYITQINIIYFLVNNKIKKKWKKLSIGFIGICHCKWNCSHNLQFVWILGNAEMLTQGFFNQGFSEHGVFANSLRSSPKKQYIVQIWMLWFFQMIVNVLEQRCPTLLPIATCGEKYFKCDDRHNYL